VVMPNKLHGQAALSALHHHVLHGQAMTVEVARPVPPRRHRRS
jgi:hypothetical protein